MELKVKFLRWSAGLPVAMLHKETAEKIGVHTTGRISIKTLAKYPKELSTLIDIIEGKSVKKNEIVVSSEIRKRMGLRKNQKVDINIAPFPKSTFYIKKKLDGKELSEKELLEIIRDIVKNSISELEVALFISSVYKNGMSFKETVGLIKAISKSGKSLGIKNKNFADKHSIGGVAGNRTTPLVVSICAAAGLIMPKTSSKAITSAAGTADVIETITNIEFQMKDLKKILRKTGAFMVWGGGLGMVPADSKIIKVEKALKIDPEAQLLASIMSKKLSVGSKYIIIDIPYGKGAKVSKPRALRLKRNFERLGKYFKKKIKIVITDGTQPIGNGVGPALELIDLINILDPKKKGPKDLRDKSVFLSAELLELVGRVKKGKGKALAEEMLNSGKAYDKFEEIIKAQGGKIVDLKLGKFKKDILAKRAGKVVEMDNKKINTLARAAGCPIDKYSGLYLYVHKKDKVKKGSKLLTIYAEAKPRLNEAIRFYEKVKPIKIK